MICFVVVVVYVQESFIVGGGVTCFRDMLINETFLLADGDDNTSKAILFYLLKINKLTMTCVCFAIYTYVLNAVTAKQLDQLPDHLHQHALLLQNSVGCIPSSSSEITVRTLAQRLGAQFATLLLANVADMRHVVRLERIAWSLAATGSLRLIAAPFEHLVQHMQQQQPQQQSQANHQQQQKNQAQQQQTSGNSVSEMLDEASEVFRESLECLTLTLCLVPSGLDSLLAEKHWRLFLVDMVLACSSRIVRHTAAEQFLLIALRCSLQPTKPIQFFIQMLFTSLASQGGLSRALAAQSHEYFHLLCRLLNCAHVNQVPIGNTETLLNNELAWLKRTKENWSTLASSTSASSASSAAAVASSSPTSANALSSSVGSTCTSKLSKLFISKNSLRYTNAF